MNRRMDECVGMRQEREEEKGVEKEEKRKRREEGEERKRKGKEKREMEGKEKGLISFPRVVLPL